MFEEAEKFAITFELDLEASISHYPILLCFYFWNERVYSAPLSNKLFELLLTRTCTIYLVCSLSYFPTF